MAERCIAPGEIQEGELLAFLEGGGRTGVAAHLARCASCAADLVALRDDDLRFAAALFRASCPEPDELLLFEAGLLAGAEQRRIKRHVAECNDCRNEVSRLAVPAALAAVPSLRERVSAAGKQLLRAVLSPPQPAPAMAMRGAQAGRSDYQAGSYRVTLAVVPPLAAEGAWQVEGQIIGEDDNPAAGAAVSLLENGVVVAHDSVDEFGYFVLEATLRGVFTLEIESGAEVIRIEDFRVP